MGGIPSGSRPRRYNLDKLDRKRKAQMKTIDALARLVDGFLEDQAAAPPDILWHYTNAAGFLGICRSGKLWATNTDYLNDASEMRHARRLVLKAVFAGRSS